MKIVVCVNHVPDTATKVNISSDQKTIDQSGVTYVVNPYDEYAIEEALKTKENFGGEVVAISAGPESNKESLRKALAMGIDEAVLLKTDSEMDSISTARILADEIKNQGAEIVFMGKQSVDYDNSITGQLTAALLGFNSVTVVVDLKIDGDKITTEREVEGGKEVVETSLPAVITAQKGLNTPRFPSMKGIMTAKRKTIEEKPVEIGELTTKVLSMRKPPAKEPGRIIGEDASAVPELIRLLKEEAKVI
ncbi:Electron transfer flavoprotein, beta subunit [hydrothermal vent metagenome]|uniref:Electron transfer flavoprotein, beta subunit n=1 Tax=hydrothermal vent metagenome TaxID=652676 RepID=A0A3B1BUS6_9ZZZZ